MKQKKFDEKTWFAKKPLYIDKSDDRYDKHVKQLKKRGFSDTETWSLYSCIASFTLPRLIRFKEINNGFPGGLSEDKWNEILDKIILALTIIDKDDITEDNVEQVQEGLKLFGEYFTNLWW